MSQGTLNFQRILCSFKQQKFRTERDLHGEFEGKDLSKVTWLISCKASTRTQVSYLSSMYSNNCNMPNRLLCRRYSISHRVCHCCHYCYAFSFVIHYNAILWPNKEVPWNNIFKSSKSWGNVRYKLLGVR